MCLKPKRKRSPPTGGRERVEETILYSLLTMAVMNYIKIYADFLKKFLRPRQKLKVVFDCSNGVAGPIIKQLTTDSQQLKTFLINEKSDGNFPAHGPNPLKPNALKQLQNEVKKHKATLGIIFDADGDRVFFIDNRGRFVDPDVISRLLIWHLKPKKVVIDVRTGWLVRKFKIKNSKLKIHESSVGHYFIKKLMRKTNADLGVERSGHYYFGPNIHNQKNLYFDSGILAAIETINAVSKLPYSLADFSDLFPPLYRSGEINIKIGQPQNIIKKIEKKLKNQAIKTSRLDGLTMEFNPSASPGKAWRFNLRPSNTEPLVRLNIEATDKRFLDNFLKKIYSLISN